MNKELLLVDLLDRPIGYAEKHTAHLQGLLHRAFSVFLFDKDMILLQRRADSKYHSGGLWSNSCCSHQYRGEDLLKAAHIRLSEELGIDCEIEEQFSFVYRATFAAGLSEYEYDHVFTGEFSGNCSPDHNEISELKWIDSNALLDWMRETPEEFSAWFIISAPEVIRRKRGTVL